MKCVATPSTKDVIRDEFATFATIAHPEVSRAVTFVKATFSEVTAKGYFGACADGVNPSAAGSAPPRDAPVHLKSVAEAYRVMLRFMAKRMINAHHGAGDMSDTPHHFCVTLGMNSFLTPGVNQLLNQLLGEDQGVIENVTFATPSKSHANKIVADARKKMASASDDCTPFGVIAKRVFPGGIIFVNLKETPDELIRALGRVQHEGVLLFLLTTTDEIQSATHAILRQQIVKSMFGKVLNIPDKPFDARDGDAILAGFSAMHAAQAYAKRAMQCDMYARFANTGGATTSTRVVAFAAEDLVEAHAKATAAVTGNKHVGVLPPLPVPLSSTMTKILASVIWVGVRVPLDASVKLQTRSSTSTARVQQLSNAAHVYGSHIATQLALPGSDLFVPAMVVDFVSLCAPPTPTRSPSTPYAPVGRRQPLSDARANPRPAHDTEPSDSALDATTLRAVLERHAREREDLERKHAGELDEHFRNFPRGGGGCGGGGGGGTARGDGGGTRRDPPVRSLFSGSLSGGAGGIVRGGRSAAGAGGSTPPPTLNRSSRTILEPYQRLKKLLLCDDDDDADARDQHVPLSSIRMKTGVEAHREGFLKCACFRLRLIGDVANHPSLGMCCAVLNNEDSKCKRCEYTDTSGFLRMASVASYKLLLDASKPQDDVDMHVDVDDGVSAWKDFLLHVEKLFVPACKMARKELAEKHAFTTEEVMWKHPFILANAFLGAFVGEAAWPCARGTSFLPRRKFWPLGFANAVGTISYLKPKLERFVDITRTIDSIRGISEDDVKVVLAGVFRDEDVIASLERTRQDELAHQQRRTGTKRKSVQEYAVVVASATIAELERVKKLAHTSEHDLSYDETF